jgi:hypothetical protein
MLTRPRICRVRYAGLARGDTASGPLLSALAGMAGRTMGPTIGRLWAWPEQNATGVNGSFINTT